MDRGTRTDWIADRALRGLIGGALVLPYAARVRAMGATTRRLLGPLAGYGARARANLAAIRPDLTEAERRRIADAALDNMGRTLIENYGWRDLRARLAATVPAGEGLAALAAARAEGRPVIFVTGHFGNYEAPRHVLTRMGHEIGGLYKPMGNPFFDAHYSRTMQDISGPVFAKGTGTIGFARHLRGGGMATLLFDVRDTTGTAIPFLGRPAWTSLAAAQFALRFDAELIPYFGRRRANGLDFDVDVEAPIPRSDPLEMTGEMTRRLEARIVADPGQWFWIHRRWQAPSRGRAVSARR